jgi:hypothetical protein
MTLEGAIDRDFIPTRSKTDDKLILVEGSRPANMADWGISDAAKLDDRAV